VARSGGFSALIAAAAAAACWNSSAALPAADGSRSQFTIPAYAFERGNAKIWTDYYADPEPMVTWGGQYPVVVEYDVDFPVTAQYTFWIRYAQAELRTAELFVDGKSCGPCCRTVTGTWQTSGARWEETCRLDLAQGKHTVKLQRNGPFPHVVSLRVDCARRFPAAWKPARPAVSRLDLARAPLAMAATPAQVDLASLRLAIEDLLRTFGPRYPGGKASLRRLDALESRLGQLKALAERGEPVAGPWRELHARLAELERDSLLANPWIDFDKLLVVRRSAASPQLGLPMNWQSNSSLPKSGFDDRIMLLSPVRPGRELKTLFRPGGKFVGDVDLGWRADRLLFSMVGRHDRWQVFEIRIDGSGLRPLTGDEPDVDSYDACYLPDGRIAFTSTACYHAVPCTGVDDVAVLYSMNADGSHVRQLCFDQDHDWCPTVLSSGRILYSRWEYADLVHCHSRRLFSMNPDGTDQAVYYGTNSYWPNAIFYARPIPGHPTKVVAVISGHHGVPRMGELVIFDPARGRREAEGAIQRIPGRGKKVEAVLKDQLADNSWPKFLHPFPLSDKYFLAAAQPRPGALWGIYLVDVFDNVTLVKELPGFALLEPVPLRPTAPPPVIPGQIDPRRKDATVYIADIYAGPGLRGIPRGAVRALRVISYHFAYRGMVSNPNTIGIDGPWDIKRIQGTVPVCPDGSVYFRVPANTPLSVQPLDAEGKALQLMRSWFTAMPGETVQCAGCHEPQNTAPPLRRGMALESAPEQIRPWYGPPRGFSYRREVQPVLDRYCTGCHDGRTDRAGTKLCDLRGAANVGDYRSVLPWQLHAHAGRFSVGYAELHRFVRRPGAESDQHLLEPMEFHADTTELVQTLRKGHHGVQLDPEAWDRLITWIDLNCPFHGTRHEELMDPGPQRQRRRELARKYAGTDDDPEAVPPPGTGLYNSGRRLAPLLPGRPGDTAAKVLSCRGWPFDASEARRRQAAWGPAARTVELGHGQTLSMVLIPPGAFLMGSEAGPPDERPRSLVQIERPFWMAAGEITNRQYAMFDPGHDSGFESKNATQYGVRGYPVNRPEQPVVRVSWHEARRFCAWLSRETGGQFRLPTEAEWEYACRAGTATPFWYGDFDRDFSGFANLADAKLAEFASDVWNNDLPLRNPTRYDEWFPKDARFNDGALVSVAPARYRANPWGLADMHGNVAEWTGTVYRPYPYQQGDGEDPRANGPRAVRGGSWFDRPARATSSFRLAYQPFQRVFNVGFRVICQADAVQAAPLRAANLTRPAVRQER
jgi:formylglycine-generating enzyme required for sulfatase activity